MDAVLEPRPRGEGVVVGILEVLGGSGGGAGVEGRG